MIEELQGQITVAYEEVSGSPVETFTDRGFEAARILECAFADRMTLAGQLRGGNRLMGGVSVYTRPQRYPHYQAAVVDEVRVEPFGATVAGDSALATAYELARLSVTYRVPEYGWAGLAEQTLVSESLEPVVEFLTLPHEQFYWDEQASEPLSESEAPGKLVRMLDWVYTCHQALAVPAATLSLVGKVNDVEITSVTLGVSFPAQTLLYNPPHLEREITTEGAKAWRLTYRFTYRPETWNKFPRRGRGSMQTIYVKDGGGSAAFLPYEPADFSAIMG